jgi:hypothetical protein
MAGAEYQFPITQCDVPPERRATLEAFRSKRKEWVTWLDDDEHHAIWTTLSSLVWNDVSFRTLAQIALDNEKSSLRNSLVADAVINGHVATQNSCDTSAHGHRARKHLIAPVAHGNAQQFRAVHP